MANNFEDNYSILPRDDSIGVLYNNNTEDRILLTKFHKRQIWQIVEENDIRYVKAGHSDCNAIAFFTTFEGWEKRSELYFN